MATIPQLTSISAVDDSTSIVGYRNSTGRISVGTLKSYLSTTTALPVLPISNVTGLQVALDAKQASSARGVANGYAPLDSTGKVPAVNLPAASGGSGSAAVAISDVTGLQVALNDKQNLSDRGSPNGYAPLDGSGKVPTTYLPPVTAGITAAYLTPILTLTSNSSINQENSHNKIYIYDSPNAVFVTLEARDVGTTIRFVQIGNGQISFLATSGGQRIIFDENNVGTPYQQPAQTILSSQNYTKSVSVGSSVMAVLIKPTVWHLSGALM